MRTAVLDAPAFALGQNKKCSSLIREAILRYLLTHTLIADAPLQAKISRATNTISTI
jgi:hypothetical protein